MDARIVLIILQLIYLEGILSIDNAAVLGAMVAHLPTREPIPWPHTLQRFRQPIHRIMGGQLTAALRIGLPGAYVGRMLMLLIANWVIQNSWLLLLGALYLIKLAVDFLGKTPHVAVGVATEASGQPLPRAQRSFWDVVIAVVLVDLTFSLDNVVAAVALSRTFWVVVTGVLLGITTMRFAAQISVHVLKRYPILETAAYLLVLNLGVELLLENLAHIRFSDVAKFGVSLGTLALTLLYARSATLQRVGRHWIWVRRILGFISLLFAYVLKPVVWLVVGVAALLRALALILAPHSRRAGRARVHRTAHPGSAASSKRP